MRVALYTRVSSAGQSDDGSSLETQAASCRAYAEAHGWQVVGVWSDVASGGAYRERPALSELRALVRSRAVDVVLCHAIDRLSRNQAHLAILIEEMTDHGCRPEFVTETFEQSAVGRFLVSARAFAAELEREKIAERTVRGKRARVERGLIPNQGPELYGYRRDRLLGIRNIHEPEAVTVRRIYQSIVTGWSLRSIARALNDEGVPSPSSVAHPERPSRWGLSQLYLILHNPAYKGEPYAWRWRRTGSRTTIRPAREWIALPPETCPAIIDVATWEAAQTALASNHGQRARNARRPALLRGMVTCAVCGLPCYPERDQQYRYYRCSSHQRARGRCGAGMIPADALEADVWSRVAVVLIRPDVVRQMVATQDDGQGETVTRGITTLAAERDRLRAHQARVLARYRGSDAVPWDLIEREIAATERERLGIERRLTALEAERAVSESRDQNARDLADWCATVSGNVERFTFEDKRLALEVFGVRVIGAGKTWEITPAWLASCS